MQTEPIGWSTEFLTRIDDKAVLEQLIREEADREAFVEKIRSVSFGRVPGGAR